ncbi:MAG: Crp/Fnr family transcriptional regulator [Ruminococcus sp.]|nr:Crp/Fnr family transcriptional regulator [Ruminococcus sp.]
MRKYPEILKECKLFMNIEEKNISALLDCLGAEIRSYKKNQNIFSEGDTLSHIGIILSGKVQIIRIDFYGNRSILTTFGQTEIFGEAFACAEIKSVPVSAFAENDCEIIFIDSNRILKPCCNACGFHSRLIFNLMKSVAVKNLILNQKIEIISKRSTREKLLSYLMIQAKQHNSNSFEIPYSRQELADFLEVDRSGLSAEISKLKNQNVIECKRNFFKLI